MQAAITSGEGYAWYYQSAEARRARQRSPITDGGAGKPWIFRYKDIESWWANRITSAGRAELTSPTAWAPKAKPIWLTDLAAPRSTRARTSPTSSSIRNRPKAASLTFPIPAGPTACSAASCRRTTTGGRAPSTDKHGGPGTNLRLDLGWRALCRLSTETDVWSDGQNWVTGHWLTGRLGAGTLADVIAAILADHGFRWFDVSAVAGDLTGYVQADTVSARSLIEPLVETFLIDVIEDRGILRFRSRPQASLPPTIIDVLAEKEGNPPGARCAVTTAILPRKRVVSFAIPFWITSSQCAFPPHYRRKATASCKARLPAFCTKRRRLVCRTPAARQPHRTAHAESAVSPAMLSLSAGDPIRLSEGPDGVYLVTRIEDGEVRQLEARRHEPAALLTKVTETAARANASDVLCGFRAASSLSRPAAL